MNYELSDSRQNVTEHNIQGVRATMAALDQQEALEIGCETWGIIYDPGSQRGQITTWPNGRAAICFGGNSSWGDYDSVHRLIVTDDGDAYNEIGERVCSSCDRLIEDCECLKES